MHLNSFNAEKLVSIGEDATRVIARVEYDCESNKLIGFVLPCDENGLPIREAFTATTFESIEDAFRTGAIAKYALLTWFNHFLRMFQHFAYAACVQTTNLIPL